MDISPATPLGELLAEARRVRERHHGNRVTYSPKVFIPLTMLCRDHCGYCTFAKPPARLGTAAYLTPEQVLEIARAGAAAGCHEALFTLGERPEERYPVAREALAALGHASTVEYLAASCRLVLTETGLLPHANAGALFPDELAALRRVSASQGMMLESLSERLHQSGGPHARCATKVPERRLATLEAAGELGIPFTTGILVGIGETRAERLEALAAIAAAHRRHGHVQEVIVQNFRPKPGTAMAAAAPPPLEDHLWTIAAARVLLPPEVHLQAPPNLTEDFGVLLEAGIDDWGGVSPVTADHVNPEAPWPALERLREVTEAAGMTLAPRLTIYPEFAADPGRWLDPDLRFPVLDRSDAEGLARDDRWAAGDPEPPPVLIDPTRFPSPTAGGRVGEVLAGVAAGQQPGEEELVALFGARGPEVRAVAELADDLRRQAVGDVVTFVRNRNINYTNVCTFRCRFCAFSKGPASLNLRGAPYLLGLDEVARRVVEADERGATEVTLQGGIHPSFDGDYYLHVAEAVHEAVPGMHIHGFTALEVHEGARRLGEPLRDYLLRLKAAGLASLPGTAAEILDDEVRAVICPDKVTTEEWLEVHRVAHSVGLRSNITIMFGHVESPRHCRPPRAGSPSSCPCRSCTWPPPCTASASPGPGRPSARPC
jgi:7,8-didemethyl-8-hydroxy-5-deazariboflavin synthase CofG subunit